MSRESNKEWKQYGNNFTTENLCKAQHKAEHFNARFSAPLDEETCSIPAVSFHYIHSSNL